MDNVRLASHGDVLEIEALARNMREESPYYSTLDYSEKKVRDLICTLIKLGGALVAERDGIIVGMMGFFVIEHLFGTERIASDVVIYVDPAARGGTLGVRLIRAFESYARAQSADYALLNVSSDIDAERTVQLYQRLGYAKRGGAYTKRLKK